MGWRHIDVCMCVRCACVCVCLCADTEAFAIPSLLLFATYLRCVCARLCARARVCVCVCVCVFVCEPSFLRFAARKRTEKRGGRVEGWRESVIPVWVCRSFERQRGGWGGGRQRERKRREKKVVRRGGRGVGERARKREILEFLSQVAG